MLFLNRVFVSFFFFVFATADDCFAPAKDGCSRCSASERQGTQCVRSGRWFACSADNKSCCENPEIRDYETCLQQDDNSLCNKVISKTDIHNNDYCFTKCANLLESGSDVMTDADFTRDCMYEHFEVINGRTKVDGTCFETWIYGYSEPNENASYKLGLTAETPAVCQLLCQQDSECVNWIWTHDKSHQCSLKNNDMVTKAAEIKFTSSGSVNMDFQYCNAGLPYMCTSGTYNCLPCDLDGVPSCIWESHNHVSGWRFCGQQSIACNSRVSTVTPPEKDPTSTLSTDATELKSTQLTDTTQSTTSTSVLVQPTASPTSSSTSIRPTPPMTSAQGLTSESTTASATLDHRTQTERQVTTTNDLVPIQPPRTSRRQSAAQNSQVSIL